MERFGKTLMFVFFILIFILGAQMALKISVPYIHSVSASLADAIQST
jgi:hypothetical protein